MYIHTYILIVCARRIIWLSIPTDWYTEEFEVPTSHLWIVQCQHGASVSQSRNFFKARQIPLLVEDPHTCLGNDIWHKPSTKEPSSCACMTLHSTQATYTAAPQQPGRFTKRCVVQPSQLYTLLKRYFSFSRSFPGRKVNQKGPVILTFYVA